MWWPVLGAVSVLVCVSAQGGLRHDITLEGIFDDQLYEESVDEERCARQLDQMTSAQRFQLYDASFRFPQGFSKLSLAAYGDYFTCLNLRQDLPDGDQVEGKHCMILLPDNLTEVVTVTPPTRPPWLPEIPDIPWLPFPRPDMDDIQSQLDELKTLTRAASPLVGPGFTRSNDTSPLPTPTEVILRLRLGVCIPRACPLRQALAPLDSALVSLNYQEYSCRLPNDRPYAAADYVAFVIFPLIGLVTLLSTAYEVRHVVLLKGDPKSLSPLYTSFSVYSNTRKLFTFRDVPGAITCLDGIRSLSITWVVIGHTFLSMLLGALTNLQDALEFAQDARGLWMSSANICVDTFFMMSGLLLVYTSIHKMTQASLIKNLHMYYLNRYLRMLPILAAAVLLQASWMLRALDGANWQLEGLQVQTCRRFWWAALLHIQNWYNPQQECLPHTWYLAVDFQLHILSPLVLFWLLAGRRTGWASLAGALLASVAGTAIYVFLSNFDGTMFGDPTFRFFRWYYVNTLTRSPVFIVGMIYGYLMHGFKGKKLQLPKTFVAVCWLASLTLMSCVIYVYLPVSKLNNTNQLLNNFSNSFKRTIWSVAVGWLIFACAHGYGGPINWFLSLTVWKFIARISYAMYILHYPMQFLKASTIVAPQHFSVYHLWVNFTYDFSITVLSSTIMCIVIDSPFSTLQRLWLASGSKKKRPAPEVKPVETKVPDLIEPGTIAPGSPLSNHEVEAKTQL
ncbi:hypothetical protein JYU34_009154 [Plutella xylostella]|uniref:Acyltransferase 3 domain-containing protein n=1 Tax=Plutella xylostella TaxID=51655 RepID=A0ABQ7QNA0_PLUXY|nr:hypothetical protein JYU34_009154 [Plutella xylostella]